MNASQKIASIVLVLTACPAYAHDHHHEKNKREELTIHQLSPIAFGSFACSARGGSITINPNGGRVATGSIAPLSMSDYGPAEFDIRGEPGEELEIDVPENIILDQDTGNGTLRVHNLALAPPQHFITLDNSGHAKIKIGGTLRAHGHVPVGRYSGYFPLMAHYARGDRYCLGHIPLLPLLGKCD